MGSAAEGSAARTAPAESREATAPVLRPRAAPPRARRTRRSSTLCESSSSLLIALLAQRGSANGQTGLEGADRNLIRRNQRLRPRIGDAKLMGQFGGYLLQP